MFYSHSGCVGSPWGPLRVRVAPFDDISGGMQPAEPPGMSRIFFLNCFLAAVKPGQACQKNDIVLEIHFPYLEMKPGAIYVSEPHFSSE